MKISDWTFRVFNNKFSHLALLSFFLLACSPEVSIDKESSFNRVVHSKDILVLGEFHGTQEIGDVLIEMISEQAKTSSVAIGLEAPYCALVEIFPQEKILSLPGDDGETCDQSALLMGRISDALYMSVNQMIDLHDVKIFGLEDHEGRVFRFSKGTWDANEWEAHVSDRILQIHNKGYNVTAIAGNLHTRKTNYKFGGPSVKPFGARLSDKAMIIELSPQKGGHAYACQTNTDCREMEIPASANVNPIGLNCSIGKPEYDCLYTVKKYTAAKPLEISIPN